MKSISNLLLSQVARLGGATILNQLVHEWVRGLLSRVLGLDQPLVFRGRLAGLATTNDSNADPVIGCYCDTTH